MKDSEHRFESQLRQKLEESAETLDDATQQRLRRARREALAQRTDAHSRHWEAFAVAASVAALAVGLWLHQADAPQSFPPEANIEAIELLAAQEDMEFYEDLDFYLWLESQAGQG